MKRSILNIVVVGKRKGIKLAPKSSRGAIEKSKTTCHFFLLWSFQLSLAYDLLKFSLPLVLLSAKINIRLNGGHYFLLSAKEMQPAFLGIS